MGLETATGKSVTKVIFLFLHTGVEFVMDDLPGAMNEVGGGVNRLKGYWELTDLLTDLRASSADTQFQCLPNLEIDSENIQQTATTTSHKERYTWQTYQRESLDALG